MQKRSIQLEADETILFTTRRHWFILAVEVAALAFLVIMPPFFYFVLLNVLDLASILAAYLPIGIAFYAIWLLILWMALFNVWTNYYLDVWTLNNKRFITVDQRGFFSRTIASFRLERLQDANIAIHGLIATFFNFGSVEIQTASEDGLFKMSQVPDPEGIKARILAAAGALRDNASASVHDGM